MKKLELEIGKKYNYWTILSLSDFVSKRVRDIINANVNVEQSEM